MHQRAGLYKILSLVRTSGANALGCAVDNIWVVFQAVPEGWYVQGREPNKNPPVVIVKAQAGRSSEQREALAKAIAEAVGRGLSVPATRVWLHYQEMRPQDVWFEGHWSD